MVQDQQSVIIMGDTVSWKTTTLISILETFLLAWKHAHKITPDKVQVFITKKFSVAQEFYLDCLAFCGFHKFTEKLWKHLLGQT